jgi:hypothetical protein
LKFALEATTRLKMELVEYKVTSIEELRAGLDALRPGEADAFVLVSDGMVISQTDLVVEVTNAKRLRRSSATALPSPRGPSPAMARATIPLGGSRLSTSSEFCWVRTPALCRLSSSIGPSSS